MYKLRLSFACFVFFLLTAACFAQEVNEASWDKIYSEYGNINPERRKPVSDEEFEKALEVRKQAQKKKKKTKKKDKKIKRSKKDEVFSANDTLFINRPLIQRDILFRLPCNVYYKKKIIPQGFYSLTPFVRGNQYFLNLIQSNTTIAEIEMNKVNENLFPDEFQYVKYEIVENKYLKLQYKNLDFSLERYFYIEKK